jgi:hypothetical protein
MTSSRTLQVWDCGRQKINNERGGTAQAPSQAWHNYHSPERDALALAPKRRGVSKMFRGRRLAAYLYSIFRIS